MNWFLTSAACISTAITCAAIAKPHSPPPSPGPSCHGVQAMSLLGRPETKDFITSQAFPIRVHWSQNVDAAYARDILSAAEMSWQRMFLEMGFLQPHPDGAEGGSPDFDIYIVTNLQPGVGGYTGFSGFRDDTPRADAIGYVVVAHNLSPRFLRGVVAHELFHASQIAYDWWEDIAFMEGSSTWVVDHVFNDENIYWKYYSYYNRQPWKALDFISLADPYQYGSGMFLQFLDEKYGLGDGALIREAWEKSPQDDMANEPDYFDAIDSQLQSLGQSFDEAFHEFGSWRLFVGPRNNGRYFREGGDWGEDILVPFELDSPWSGNISGQLQKNLQPYSHAFMRLTKTQKQQGWPQTLRIQSSDRTRLRVRHVLNGPDVHCHGDSDIMTESDVVRFDSPCMAQHHQDADELFIYITNLGTGSYDPELPEWTESTLTWTLFADEIHKCLHTNPRPANHDSGTK